MCAESIELFLQKVARVSVSSAREGGNMHDLRSLRTKVDQRKRPNPPSADQPLPESPPERPQCEHCLGNNEKYRLDAGGNVTSDMAI